MAAETVSKSDKCSIVFEALEDGKILMRANAWPDGKTLPKGQVGEIRWRDNQINVISRADDAPPAEALSANEAAVTAMAE
jgi:hypothetical protein